MEVVNLPKNANITNDIWIAYRKEDVKNKNIELFIKTLRS
ncbi:hypothetical protein CRYPD_419 [uncultured Candidatus Thioglobus sp.]|nr:hypothetical protein CRYPD_419 [uncultured Candidatus Thioglobus sp.]